MNREQLLSYFELVEEIPSQTSFVRKADDYVLIIDCDDLGLQLATDMVIYDDGALLVFASNPNSNALINVNGAVGNDVSDFDVEVYVKQSVAESDAAYAADFAKLNRDFNEGKWT